ncbi:WD repeat-containing protein 7 [Tyrophagus putrescentiae]|nr:WD repeat-containing protein 7 [Tyrophagus putrescentiae]
MESDGEADDDEADDGDGHLSSSLKALKGVGGSSVGSEGRRRQATAIILMGVIGFEYGSEITGGGGVEAGSGQAPKQQPPPRPAPPPRPPRPGEAPPSANGAVPNLNIPHGAGNERRKSLIEGFGGGGNYSLARKTSKALSYLLLAPPMSSLPYHTSLRRAAIDLIGRGLHRLGTVLLALLEFSSAEGETNLVPSGSFGLPLTPVADSSRTARAAIRAISHARPSVFITTLAREVTRYNTMQQQQQSLNFIPNQTVLYRARPEILKNLHRLIDEHQDAVYSLIIEAMDIILYCLDHNALKARGLGEMYPAITSFQNVTFCNSSKRVAVGARNGNLAIYELKTGKNQIIAAHSGKPITACAFAPDGKHLASYCAGESKVSFWLTAVGLFGLGKSQTQCVKSHPSPPMPEAVRALGPLRSAKLVWVSSKLLILLFADGKEHRFSI